MSSDILKKYESIHFKHDIVLYVPCFIMYPKKESDSYPTFHYSYADATTDEQRVWAMEPDYVLVLRGTFDAKTQPFDLEILKYNQKGDTSNA